MRDWYKYHNSQLYSECSLVTALNAQYYLTGKFIKQNSTQYEKLVDLCKAREGSAICIEKIYKRLKIEVARHFESWFDYKRALSNAKDYTDLYDRLFPAEVKVWEKHYGFHSVCLVDYEGRSTCFRVTNFRYQTSLSGWMFDEDFNHFTEHGLTSINVFRRC